jgi:hypothetical protein
VSDDTQKQPAVVVSLISARPRGFFDAVSDQEVARDRAKDRVHWQQGISQSAYADNFPTLAAAAIEKELPPSLFHSLCETLLDNRWIAEAIADDIRNLTNYRKGHLDDL